LQTAQGASLPRPEDLEIVWFEEGNGAALFLQGEHWATIPPWSGQGDFAGYARDCLAESPVCWPMPDNNTLVGRIRGARDYWSMWDDEGLWAKSRDNLVAAINRSLGKEHSRYFAIDGNRWPPKAMLLYERTDHYVLITAGVSLVAQPNVEQYMEEPSAARRIELAAAFDRSCPVDELLAFGSYISAQSGYPWTRFQWLGEGHTLPCDSTPPALGGRRFDSVALTAMSLNAPRLDLSPFRNDPINVLWMAPITPSEREFAMTHATKELFDMMSAAGVGYIHRRRRAVA
jgi:hypothetical protein